MTRRILLFVSIICLVGIFYFLNPAVASSNIIINEIGAYESSDHEWLEIFNRGSSPIDITGWKFFEDDTNHGLSLHQGDDLIIEPGEYAIIADVATNFISDYPAFTGTVIDSSWTSLSEAGETVELRSSSDPATVQESFTYLPTSYFSLERANPNLDDYTAINWQEHASGNTAGQQNSNFYLGPINLPPTAIIAISTTTAEIGQLINFDASGSTDDVAITNYGWDFGDSNTSNLVTTSHAYSSAGDFTISLTVTDGSGLSNSTSTVIKIFSPAASSTTPTVKPGDIVINEFLSYADTSKNEPEWVEFFNNTTSTVDLSGWTISDNSSTTTLSGIIEATGTARFLVWETSGKLNNDGDIIVLKNQAGQIIDQLAYGSFDDGDKSNNAPDPGKSYASARNIDGLNSGNNKNDFSETITPTKGLPNLITPKPTPPSSGGGNTVPTPPKEQPDEATTTEKIVTNIFGKVIINEFLPNPDGDDEEGEFIELKNIDDKEINLAGWQLADNSNKKYTLASSTITVDGFVVVKRLDSQIALNNSGVEAVSLYAPDGKLVDRVEYTGPAKDDYSYSRDKNGKWQWSVKLTPGEENFIESENVSEPDDGDEPDSLPTKTSSKAKTTTKKTASTGYYAGEVLLENIRELDLGTKIKIKGLVGVEPGVLGSQVFYLIGSAAPATLERSDSGRGIQVYCYKKDFPDLRPGDYIEVNGELSESGGERRIKITKRDDIKILEKGKPVESEKVATADIGEDTEGSLVTIEGELLEIKSSNLYLDDGSAEAKVYIKSSTGINLKSLGLQEGDKVRVTGIVSQTSGGYRLLPRYQKDLEKIGEVKGEAEMTSSVENKNTSPWLKYLVAIVIFLLVIIIWLIKKYVLKKK